MTFDILDLLLVLVLGVCLGLGIMAFSIGAFGCYQDCHLCLAKKSEPEPEQES